MLGLLRSAQVPGRFKRCRVTSEPAGPFGLSCVLVTVTVPERVRPKKLERALDEAASLLRGLNVRTIIPAEDFGYTDEITSRGFRLQDCRALLVSKAAEILSASATDHRRVLISSRRFDRETAESFRRLAAAFRYVTALMPATDFDRLSAEGEKLGVSPETLPRTGVTDADAALILGELPRPIALPPTCAVLAPDGPTPLIHGGREVDRVAFRLPAELGETVPAGFICPQVVAATLEAGRVRAADVAVVTD